ncbi:MAG: hypothetical protein IIC73_01530 [Armatimonadetes bacterium]|nr:hypothetical protein [Armatimonadota bacterium]
MGQLDGAGRVYWADLNLKVERDLQVDRTEGDRKRRDKDDRQDEEPQDTVEIHDEAEGSEAAQKPKATESDEDGLDISA